MSSAGVDLVERAIDPDPVRVIVHVGGRLVELGSHTYRPSHETVSTSLII